MFVRIANSTLISPTARRVFLRPARVDSRGFCLLYRGIEVTGPGRLSLGVGSFVNRGCRFETGADITVGDRVFIADHVRVHASHGAPVEIGDGCWVGSGVVVMPGVRIGNGCVIGTNSVVTGDLKADGLYVGNPAALRQVLD